MLSILDSSVRDKVRATFRVALIGEVILTGMMLISCNVLYSFAWNSVPITVVSKNVIAPFYISSILIFC